MRHTSENMHQIRVEETYHLLSEITPSAGLNITDTPANARYIPFSHSTRITLAKLKIALGGPMSEAITPLFTLTEMGQAELAHLAIDASHDQAGKARKKLHITSTTQDATLVNADQIAALIPKLRLLHTGLSGLLSV